jgi:hypothetical protein
MKQNTDSSMTSGAAKRKSDQTNLPFISCNFPFSPHGHSSLLVFAINRTIALLWEVSLSHPL